MLGTDGMAVPSIPRAWLRRGATVEYYRSARDIAPTVETYANGADAHQRARYLAVDMLATPVVVTDAHGVVTRY